MSIVPPQCRQRLDAGCRGAFSRPATRDAIRPGTELVLLFVPRRGLRPRRVVQIVERTPARFFPRPWTTSLLGGVYAARVSPYVDFAFPLGMRQRASTQRAPSAIAETVLPTARLTRIASNRVSSTPAYSSHTARAPRTQPSSECSTANSSRVLSQNVRGLNLRSAYRDASPSACFRVLQLTLTLPPREASDGG